MLRTLWVSYPQHERWITQLEHAVPIADLDAQREPGVAYPDVLAQWHRCTARRRPQDALVVYVKRFAHLRDHVRQDPAYPAIRDAVERDIRLVVADIAQDVYLYGSTLAIGDVMDILVGIEMPDGIQSIVYDHWVTDAPSSFCVSRHLVVLGVLVVLVLVLLRRRFR